MQNITLHRLKTCRYDWFNRVEWPVARQEEVRRNFWGQRGLGEEERHSCQLEAEEAGNEGGEVKKKSHEPSGSTEINRSGLI